ncbi:MULTISPECIES: aldehyde dehydrogenase family protein [unclassified Undibacterium]|uniref:L-piperidine-6-carboxylate dehydrogenase n=2 Tax=Bacteria TaxID=2 RepID=UPI002AC90E8E|nr:MULTISPECIES: aldehyde dehydrogenase family protein [unclassified Undibacterium]MEB0138285.1 aldehyde dehydrogenase family protein [Undibacterium sp. CCC2.1]MEB0170771.1 aldehyde dehydrogenase family protein [Undibacterium sp. CCC1.1]MEB0174660.1 aldehyde dehydrogenase family protein [Undibacterium sp. CCC3.4]MEB0213857.1 aldehyde dehydrogenase family protein [Undibacterium sp. 5I2]WPX42583.1 aldehyde dehydrogenase family protein [Undibacterium sp. CCC3.4]
MNPSSLPTLLAHFGIALAARAGTDVQSISPINGTLLANLRADSADQIDAAVAQAHSAFLTWRSVPAPRRGELIRLLGEELRQNKAELGHLVTLEAGKIVQEGLGEVQEMIDICDFAVGLSRQLYGLTIASERPGHRMMEQWHPRGVVGVISAFNFPVAVWAWNAALAIVCGNSVIWKPSEKTPLTALATQALFERALARFGSDAPVGLTQVLIGTAAGAAQLVADRRVALVSATGSTRMGRQVASMCATRLVPSILELGGNNAMIVAASADLEMAVRAITFSAVGTAGQRCTTLRRLFVHDSIYDTLVPRLKHVYAALPVGNPFEAGNLVGPLIDQAAYTAMQTALSSASAEQGHCSGGERVSVPGCEAGYYVRPALVEMPQQSAGMHHETFAPILYIVRYHELQQAIAWNNEVPQGLSSAIFTTDLREAEYFVSALGSDCGIANVNIGPSGAEIGGAFGGEKETGGGRESGSDAWRAYMRRATNTFNYSNALPLAQGVSFDIV